MKYSARLATLVVLLLIALTGLAMTTPPTIARLDFRYRGGQLPLQDRESLERSLREGLRTSHPVRMIVTITDREIGTR